MAPRTSLAINESRMNVGEIPRELGRYVLYDQIAAGGMATIHFGRMHGAVGFSRLVAIKRLHPNYANDAHFVQMFLDEARLAARLDHPNVVSTFDVVADDAEVYLVMEHVLGEALEMMMPRDSRQSVPLPIISSILCGVLEGLHSAHEARGDMGEALDIVHRDVSPHNILVGVDGVARVFDFGIAKAASNTQVTREGVIKGKVRYMAPERVRGLADRRADIYAVGVILWELLTGCRRHADERNDTLFLKLAKGEIDAPAPPSSLRHDASDEIDALVARATAADPDHRFATAREMAVALEYVIPPAPARDVAQWVREMAGARIERVSAVMRRIESEVPPPIDSHLANSERTTSTGSIHVVTASIRRSGSPSITPLLDGEISKTRSTLAPHKRSWTMPAALLAFTAVMLLVGLRTLPRHDERMTSERAAANELSPRAPAANTFDSSPVLTAAPTPSEVVLTAAPSDAGPPAPRLRSSERPPNLQPHIVYASPQPPSVLRQQPHEVAPIAAPPSSATPLGHKSSCESPFAIGPDGIRQIKPECL